MNLTESHDLLHYYLQELAYLRRASSEFSEKYPKVAARLELSEGECPDPHVERLLESFALLSARIQYNIDSHFPLFTSALLDNLYPHYSSPIPSMAIAQFDIDPLQDLPANGHHIAALTPLFTQANEELICRFRTCYPIKLWPLKVTHASFESPAQYDFLGNHIYETMTVLKIRLEVVGEKTLKQLQLDNIRFFLSGIWNEVSQLYEMLFCDVDKIALLSENQTQPIMISADCIQAVGFDEEVIPFYKHAHPAYRLLQEYFAFPEKFLFFDLINLDKLSFHGKTLDILLLLKKRPKQGLAVNADNFRLGCTPMINLFKRLSEPLRVTHQQMEYRLIADLRREQSTEIHSILKVSASSDEQNEADILQPFFSFRHHYEGKDPHYFWLARRVVCDRKEVTGTDIYLNFVDLNFKPTDMALDVAYAHLLCTNRNIAKQIPVNAMLQIEETAPLQQIFCLTKPTEQRDPPLQGGTIWRLISHLNVNHLSLSSGKESLTALREMLRLYQFAAPHKPIDRQVMGIRNLEVKEITRRIGTEPWRGFVRGFEITLEFDNSFYVGGSAFLLGCVLERFFPLYVSGNSFTQLIIKNTQREGIWKKWPPRSGKKILL